MPPRTERVADVLRAARALADPASDVGARARAAAVRDCALTAPTVERAFAVACARYTPAAVASLASDARDEQRVGVVLAATVATAPLRAVALPWLAGAARITVRPSRRQPSLVRAFVDAFGRPEITAADALPESLDAVVAYGGDASLDAIARGLAPGVAFEGHGHGFGVSYVGPDAPLEAAARAVAVDVAEHDQRGCLSPQTVFVAGDAVAFAKALHAALGALEARWPRGPLGAGEGAAVAQWQGVTAARARWFRRGAAHGVGALDAAALVATPGLRNVAVCPTASVDALREALGRELPHLTCVGVAGTIDPAAWRFTRARVVAAGTMQDPPLDGPEDPR
ncbi:MAG: acyl-CoA reductase [Polyangiales bacterium]